MSNFDDLKKIRETNEAKEREKNEKTLREQREKGEALGISRQKQAESRDRFNDLVINIITEYRDVVFPKAQIIDWSIGEYRDSWSEVNLDPVWHSFVSVRINFDKGDMPKEFVCSNNRNTVLADLSREGLVVALKKLHSSP